MEDRTKKQNNRRHSVVFSNVTKRRRATLINKTSLFPSGVNFHYVVPAIKMRKITSLLFDVVILNEGIVVDDDGDVSDDLSVIPPPPHTHN